MSIPFEYVCRLYDALKEQANEEQEGQRVFRGSLVGVFRSLGISQTYYSRFYSVLTELGCIELLERGRAGQPSVMVLYHPPTEDEFNKAYKATLTRGRKPAIIEQRVSNIEGRLADIDLGSVLVNFEQRITALERKAHGTTET